MKSVSGASSTETKSSASRWGLIAAVGVGFLFILSLSNNNSSGDNDNLRSGQAQHPTRYNPVPGVESGTANAAGTAGTTGSTSAGGDGGDEGYGDDEETTTLTEEEVEEEVAEAESHFQKVVKDQIGMNQNMITTSIAKAMEFIQQQLTDLLADSDEFDSNDITILVGGIEEELNEEIQGAIKDRSAVLIEEDDEDMEMIADLDTEGGDVGEDNEVVDLKEEETKLVVQLRDGVDEIATDERSKIRHRAAVIAKDQLESLLKERLGATYIVTIDENDNLVFYSKVQTFKTPPPTTDSSSHHKSSSSGHHSSTKHKSSSNGHHSSGHKSSSHKKTSSGHSTHQ